MGSCTSIPNPRTPKMNAEIERFNRQLMDWLLWYNTRRPHWSLGLVSPLRYIVSTLSEEESQMLWAST